MKNLVEVHILSKTHKCGVDVAPIISDTALRLLKMVMGCKTGSNQHVSINGFKLDSVSKQDIMQNLISYFGEHHTTHYINNG